RQACQRERLRHRPHAGRRLGAQPDGRVLGAGAVPVLAWSKKIPPKGLLTPVGQQQKNRTITFSRKEGIMKRFAVLSMLVAFGLLWGQTGAWAQQSGDATQYTQQTFYDWFTKYKDAKPQFKPGDVLTHADLEKVRPFMLPGYFEQF